MAGKPVVKALETVEAEDLVSKLREKMGLGKAEPEEEEEEVEPIEDPLQTLKEECANEPKCEPYKVKWDECEARVSSRSKTTETCEEELFDFLHCADHCVSKQLFKLLK